MRQFLSNRLSVFGAVCLLLILIGVLMAPWITPYEPTAIDVQNRLSPPSVSHPFGTDNFGRDILSRVLAGGRISLGIGVSAVLISFVVGTLLTAVLTVTGGWADELWMRAMDIIMAFPTFVLALALVALLGPSLVILTLVIALTRVPHFARLTRSTVVSVRETEYVLAARALGAMPFGVVIRHVVPNAVTPVAILAALSIAGAINIEAGISFLGMGVQPPQASWGSLVADGRGLLRNAPWVATLPGLVIAVSALAFNLIGDALRDALDPRDG